MTQPLETAYVELRPIGEKDFKKRVEKILDDTIKTTDKKMAVVAETIEQTFDDVADDVDKSFKRINHSLNITNEIIDRDLVDSTHTFRTEIGKLDKDGNRAFSRLHTIMSRVSEVFDNVKDTAIDLFKRLRTAGGNATDSLTTGLTNLAGSIGGLIASTLNPATLISFGVTLAGIAALAPTVLAIAGAISQLSGALLLLPGLAGVAVAGIAPLVVAFQGFGEAIGAIIEKDPEKINEALKNLSPSARSVAREFEKMFPALERFQDLVQEAFFRELTGSLTSIANSLLPTLTKGFTEVASSIGRALSLFDDFFDGDIAEGIGDVFESTVRIIDSISPQMVDLFSTLFGAMEHGLPFVERLAFAFGDAAQAFSDWLSDKLQTGEFEQFLEDSFRVMGQIVDIGRELGRVFVAIFGAGKDEGEDFLVTVAETFGTLADYLESVEGQEALNRLFELVTLVGEAFILTGDAIAGTIQTIDDIGNFFDELWADIEKIPGALDAAWKSVGKFFSELGDGVERGGQAVLDWFTNLGDNIIGFVQSIPDRVIAVFTAMFDGIFVAIGQGIAVVAYLFTQLPIDIIELIKTIPGRVTQVFNDMWTSVSTTSTTRWDEFSAWLGTIPDKIRTALVATVTFVSEIFATAAENARVFFVNGFNAIIEFVRGVPGRIASAFRAAGSFVSDVGGDIVDAIRNVMNRAIDRINSGISSIDDILPGDLGRIPRLAAGAIARQPSITGEAGAEANIPLNDPRAVAMLRNALGDGGRDGGQSIVFEANAIQVSFHGVVPTEAEAFRTGQAVGNGITDSYSRRNTRAQVRTI